VITKQAWEAVLHFYFSTCYFSICVQMVRLGRGWQRSFQPLQGREALALDFSLTFLAPLPIPLPVHWLFETCELRSLSTPT
jgi:hypothetical protein